MAGRPLFNHIHILIFFPPTLIKQSYDQARQNETARTEPSKNTNLITLGIRANQTLANVHVPSPYRFRPSTSKLKPVHINTPPSLQHFLYMNLCIQ